MIAALGSSASLAFHFKAIARALEYNYSLSALWELSSHIIKALFVVGQF